MWSCSAGCDGGGDGTVAPVIDGGDADAVEADSSVVVVVADAADASVVRCIGSVTQISLSLTSQKYDSSHPTQSVTGPVFRR